MLPLCTGTLALISLSQRKATAPTQNIQGALMVGDDDIRTLCLQTLPTTHFKPKTQEIFHMTNQRADNPGRERIITLFISRTFTWFIQGDSDRRDNILAKRLKCLWQTFT